MKNMEFWSKFFFFLSIVDEDSKLYSHLIIFFFFFASQISWIKKIKKNCGKKVFLKQMDFSLEKKKLIMSDLESDFFKKAVLKLFFPNNPNIPLDLSGEYNQTERECIVQGIFFQSWK